MVIQIFPTLEYNLPFDSIFNGFGDFSFIKSTSFCHKSRFDIELK